MRSSEKLNMQDYCDRRYMTSEELATRGCTIDLHADTWRLTLRSALCPKHGEISRFAVHRRAVQLRMLLEPG